MPCSQKKVHSQVNLVHPTIRERLIPKPRRYGSWRAIRRLIETNDVLLFDMDLALADTDKEWAETYGKSLESIGIDRNRTSLLMSADDGLILDNAVSTRVDQKKIRDLLSECSGEYESAVVNKIPYRFVLDLVKEYGGKKQFVAISSLDRKRMDRILDSWGLDGVFIDDYRLSAHGSSKQGMIRDLGNHLSCQGIEIRTDNVLVFAGSEDLLKGVYEQGYDCVGIEHSWNRGRIWHCNAILSDNLVTGLFLGMSAMDIAYYLPGEPPAKGITIRTDQFALYIGGPAAIAARTFSLLGGKSILVTSIGNSEVCNALKSGLEEEGVEILDISDGTNKYPFYTSIAVDKRDGQHSIISGRLKNFSTDETGLDRFIDISDFCLYDCTLGETGKHILDAYRSNSLNPVVISAGSWAADQMDCIIDGDVTLASSVLKDENGLGAMDSPLIAGDIAVTNGGEPIRFRESGCEGTVEVERTKLVDGMSSGDVFRGAFCYYRYARGYDFRKSLEFAGRVASVSVTKHGPLRAVKKKISELSRL